MLRGRTAPTPTSRGGLEGAEPRWGEVMGATSKGCPQGCVCLMLRLRKHCHVLRGTTQEYNSVTLLQMYRVAQPPPRSTFRTFPSPKRSLVPVCNDSPSCSQPPATTHLTAPKDTLTTLEVPRVLGAKNPCQRSNIYSPLYHTIRCQ